MCMKHMYEARIVYEARMKHLYEAHVYETHLGTASRWDTLPVPGLKRVFLIQDYKKGLQEFVLC
jgi:hypothetical protein